MNGGKQSGNHFHEIALDSVLYQTFEHSFKFMKICKQRHKSIAMQLIASITAKMAHKNERTKPRMNRLERENVEMKNDAAVRATMTTTATKFHTFFIDVRLALHFQFRKCSASVFSEAIKYTCTRRRARLHTFFIVHTRSGRHDGT